MALVTPWRCAATLWVLAPRVAGWAAPASQLACHVGRWRLLLRRGAAQLIAIRKGQAVCAATIRTGAYSLFAMAG